MAEIVGRHPFTGLPNWIIRKRAKDAKWLSCAEVSVLLTLQFFANGTGADSSVFPSYNTIASYSGISRRSAIECIDSLMSKGLVKKEIRKNENGNQSNIYKMMIWNDQEPDLVAGGGAGSALGVVNQLHQGGEPAAPGVVQDLHQGGAGSAPEQEPMNKKNPEEPPMSPATKQTPEPLNGERRPAPTTPNQSRRKTGRFVAKPNDVPSTLSAVAEEVCEFFNKHKAGQHTERAFQGLLDQLAQINEDECGGINAVKSQIETAITVSKTGEKKWQSILYKNWCLYGKQETSTRQGRLYKIPSTVNMQTHPSYRPLVVDEPVTQQVEQVRLIVNRDEEFSF